MRRLEKQAAGLLGFGFVFAQSQALMGMFPRSSLAKTPKFLAAARLHFFFKRSINHSVRQRILWPVRSLAAVVLFVGLFLHGSRCAAQDTNSETGVKHVLMIFSEERDLPGNVMMEQGARSELLKDTTNRVDFYSESLDSTRFSGLNYFQLFKNYLNDKYAGQHLDLVMTFASRDFRMAQELPAGLASNCPSVFVMVNGLNLPDTPTNASFTGVFQQFDVRGTVKFMLHLQPETRRVVVVGGISRSDQVVLGQIAEMARSLDDVDFEFWTNKPVYRVYQDAKSLPEGTVMLLSSVQRDVTGRPFNTSQIIKTLAPSASVPVYVFGASSIGSGALGGSVIDFETLGAAAGKLANRALEGTPVSRIPMQMRSTGTSMVDWNAMQRWHIKKSHLPEATVILYRPHSIWEDHKTFIISVAAAFLAQAITIIALLLQRQQRQLAEAEIQHQRTELAHVSRVATIGQLASALTHELNQPLGAILRNTEAAEIILQRPEPDLVEVRAILVDLRKDNQRAGAVIDSLKTLLKRRRLQMVRIDLRELIEDTLALARVDATSRGVKLTAELPHHLPAASGDRVHLQQVLLNLVFNGMDAMKKKPKDQRQLIVRASEDKDGKMQISVTDFGIGIAPGIAAHIFEPFFTTKREGMGMGLSISGTIIEAHGGNIWAQGNSPAGTTFIFTIPRFVPGKDGLPAAS